MKLLHIGDIHLGCKLHGQSRSDEFQRVFKHLTTRVKEECVEAVLISGDVFDTGAPSNETESLYYTFLRDLTQAGCKQVVIIAGNHDSPAQLKAPKEFLQLMGIHVVAEIDREDLSKEVIPLGDPENPAAYVCAVPYLRCPDVRNDASAEAESTEARDEAFRNGVREHYRKVYKLAASLRKDSSVPILGMGHLYAQGSVLGTYKGRQQLVGNVQDVSLEGLAEGFGYLALGHIHRPQALNGHENWRYAGSLLPMNFREDKEYETQVVLLDTADLSKPRINPIPRECFHSMACLDGTLEELQDKLTDLKKTRGNEKLWVKLVCTRRPEISNWNADLLKLVEDTPIQILETELREPSKAASRGVEEAPISLSEMTPEQLFEKHMQKLLPEITPETLEEYRKLFRESQSKAEDPSQRKEGPAKAAVGRMQFQKLVIQNVNSLKGETTIDFQHPAFRDGIFLICGPTGSGKSSILDAICLALFAETPRVKITNSRDDVINSNEKELKAELTFSLGDKVYCASFQHAKKPRKQTDLQNYKHTLSENGKEIPCKSSETRYQIEKLLGMDLGEFTRCVMLAQGSFDAFLKAKPKERVEMLRKITGTERYTEIGRAINQDYRELEDQKKNLERILKTQEHLSDEELKKELAKIETNLEESKKGLQSLNEQLDEAKRHEDAFGRCEKAKKSLEESNKTLKAAESAWTTKAPEEKRRKDARRAERCRDDYDSWHNADTQHKEEESRAQDLDKERQVLQEELPQLKSQAEDAQKKLDSFQSSQKEKESLYREVRSLDSSIAEKSQTLQGEEKEEEKLQEKLKTCRQEFQTEETAWEEHSRQAKDAQRYLDGHAGDNALATQKIDWEARRKEIVSLEKDVDKKREALRNEEASWKTCEEKEKALREKVESLQAQVTSCQAEVSRLQARKSEILEGHTEGELQNSLYAAKKLEEFFQDGAKREDFLTPGKPCPLCGSTTHPYCEGTPAPQQQAQELCQRLQNQASALEEAKKALLNAEQEQGNAQHAQELQANNLANLVNQKNEALRRRNRASQEWKDAHDKAETKTKALAEEIHTLLQVEWKDHKCLPIQLNERIQKYEASRKAVDALEKERQEFQNKETAFQTESKSLQGQLTTQQAKIDTLRKELSNLRKKRQEKLGDQLVETLENALKQKEKALTDALAKDREALNTKKELLNTRTKDCAEARARLQQDAANLEALRTKWEESRAKNGFEDEASFLALRMDPRELQTLEDELNTLKAAVEKAQTTLEEKNRNVQEIQKELPPGVTHEENLARKDELAAKQKELQEEIEELKRKKKNDEDLIKVREETLQKQKELMPKYNMRKTLDDYFGSTDSRDNFGRVAQIYTFQELLHYANENRPAFFRQHFTLEMTPSENPQNDDLELSVIDHYQGDLIRTANNLSGGECFELSLALALGLAAMSAKSKRLTLGNVLLDEGFGTLDSNELTSALDLLANINTDDGKLVGIISHVEKLQERIPTKIQVTSIQGVGKILLPYQKKD